MLLTIYIVYVGSNNNISFTFRSTRVMVAVDHSLSLFDKVRRFYLRNLSIDWNRKCNMACSKCCPDLPAESVSKLNQSISDTRTQHASLRFSFALRGGVQSILGIRVVVWWCLTFGRGGVTTRWIPKIAPTSFLCRVVKITWVLNQIYNKFSAVNLLSQLFEFVRKIMTYTNHFYQSKNSQKAILTSGVRIPAPVLVTQGRAPILSFMLAHAGMSFVASKSIHAILEGLIVHACLLCSKDIHIHAHMG